MTEENIHKLKTNIISELNVLSELARNLQISGVQKAIDEEIDKIRYDSILNVNLIKKMIGEVSDEAKIKIKEISKQYKKLNNFDSKQKIKNISTGNNKTSLDDCNELLKKNASNVENLNKYL